MKKSISNLNKELSKSKDPESLLYKVVNHPEVRKAILSQKKDTKHNNTFDFEFIKNFCMVVNHPTPKIKRIIIVEVA